MVAAAALAGLLGWSGHVRVGDWPVAADKVGGGEWPAATEVGGWRS